MFEGGEELLSLNRSNNLKNPFGASLATSSASNVDFQDGRNAIMLGTLRGDGILLTAHGTKGKGKRVRLTVEGDSVCWRTSNGGGVLRGATGGSKKNSSEGKRHDVLLRDCIAVDIGKRTAPLRRIEVSAIDPKLCFSLLTKLGSLDLETKSINECETLVRAFSLLLEEVHRADKYSNQVRSLPFVESREESLVNFV